jgi:hypothetical protein
VSYKKARIYWPLLFPSASFMISCGVHE